MAENFRSVTEAGLEDAYGIKCQRLYPTVEHRTPFGASWCVIPPGGSTAPHDHHEGETFFLFSGNGEMTVDGDSRRVAARDVVTLPQHSTHLLKNASITEPLSFLSVWWEGIPETAKRLPQTSFVAIAPPTPNGGLHLGHLSGPYVAADVYVRFLRMKGVGTFFMSGSDDHQSYVPFKGGQLGLPPAEVVERFAASIEGTLERAGVALDHFLRPQRTPEYVAYVQNFFAELVDKGALVAKEVDDPYCDRCEKFLHEAYISGQCPHCGEGTAGHGCEACGVPNDGRDLREQTCRVCQATPSARRVKKFFFPMDAYVDRLRAFHAAVAMPPRMKAFTARLLARGIPELSASFVAEWGISTGLPGFEGQVIYEWLEMAAGYQYIAEQRGDANPFRAPGAELVQAFGFDNAFFYTTYLPALFLARDPGVRLPAAFLVNEFYRLDGLKFSTSRNHAIWGDEMLARVPADVVRFYLAYTRPEDEQTNFTLTEFADVTRRELVDGWDAWLASLAERAGGVVPAVTFTEETHRRFHAELVAFGREIEGHYRADRFSPSEAARVLCRLVRAARRFGRAEAWRLTENEAAAKCAVGLELVAAKQLALLASPLMPGFTAKLREALGVKTAAWDADATPLVAGTPLGRFPVGELSSALGAIERMR